MPRNEYTIAYNGVYPLASVGAQFDSDQKILNDEHRCASLVDWHLLTKYSKLRYEPSWAKPWWVQPSQVQVTSASSLDNPSSLHPIAERCDATSVSLLGFEDDQDLPEVNKRTYTCFYLLGSAIALLFASVGLSIGWSISSGDVSGGFGMGSYMLAISSVIIAVATYMHRSDCRCWVRRSVSPL
ncbi:hypothetical protein F4811DRAFT_516708 [Daldinia bambusicola]|nr:hypothetical protein F4811DRAFT_516708 [Daldinia bambusicola]